MHKKTFTADFVTRKFGRVKVFFYLCITLRQDKNMAKENIRIKDIAERAGVSVGTVDRVLHNRPNVSKKALEKVNKALEEMDYKPNMYASALAYNKSYTFTSCCPNTSRRLIGRKLRKALWLPANTAATLAFPWSSFIIKGST